MRRDLPFRGIDDPYAVWVSEVMLQQTRVDTVVPYFLRWMARLPTVAALARADEEEVLRLWSGLGYYSRARNLHRAAQQVVAQHDGRLPADLEALRRLPGIGPYTAGAIASIAFDIPAAAVDGNVLRVIARLLDDDRDLRDAKNRNILAGAAGRLLHEERPGDWNQALMELGATVCTPRRPDCPRCPVSDHCAGHRNGRAAELPRLRPKQPPVAVAVHLAWIRQDDQVLLTRSASGGLLQGLWGLPGGPVARPLATWVEAQTGLRIVPVQELGTAAHRFTHRQWHMTVFEAHPSGDPVRGDNRWVPLEALGEEAVSTAHRKAIAIACTRDPTASARRFI